MTVGIIVACCVPLTALFARTPLAVSLTGRQRAPWPKWRKRDLGAVPEVPGRRFSEAAR